ncbi:MAG: formate--tetrahydrofolate ligase, partial [Candidatus Omnitrophica bacterium]|nr:formate--tetrahydrofolate ligase [Candidatus Omnitrophota bacterium]
VSVRAVKIHGLENITRHIGIIRNFGLEPIIAINKFPGDCENDIDRIRKHCNLLGIESYLSEAVTRGGNGAIALAEACVRNLQNRRSGFKLLYNDRMPIREKVEIVAKQVYGAEGVDYSRNAAASLNHIKDLGLQRLAINIAKTQFSLSDNPKLKGAPGRWRLKVKDIRIFAGAGFIIPVCGDIMLMPGLPQKPAAWNIDTDEHGRIKGLF